MKFGSAKQRFGIVCPILLVMASYGVTHWLSQKASNQQQAEDSSSATDRQSLPTGEEIYNRFLEVSGGEDEIDQITSFHIQGEYVIQGAENTGEIELYYQRPDKLSFRVRLPEVGEFKRILNGSNGWSSGPQGELVKLQGKQLEDLRKQSRRAFSVIPQRSAIESFETIGIEQIKDQDCYAVKLKLKGVDNPVNEFFDCSTGFLVAREETNHNAQGKYELTGFISHYTRFGSLMIATQWDHQAAGQEWRARYTEIKLNVDIDSNVFTPPSGTEDTYAHRSDEEYYGNYVLPDGRVLSGGPFETPGTLLYYELQTLSINGLFKPSANNEDVYDSINDKGLTLRFSRDDRERVDGLSFRQSSDTLFHARKLPMGLEHVTFDNKGITLGGNLFLPPGKGPFGAVVFVSGSGDLHRQIGPIATFFLQHGIAVLSYDKRGVGQSEGKWREASFEIMAGDALAGVQLLRSRKEIDRKKIGIVGSSEGGWIAPIVAAKSPDVSFMILRAGPGQTNLETSLHELQNDLGVTGIEQAHIDRAIAHRKRINEFLRSGKTHKAMVEALIEPIKNEDWYKSIYGFSTPLSGWRWGFFSRNAGIDPPKIVEELSIPILWFLGEKDQNVDTKASIPRIKAAFDKSPGEDETLIVIPKVAHSFTVEDKSGKRVLSPGFFDVMEQWLVDRNLSQKQ